MVVKQGRGLAKRQDSLPVLCYEEDTVGEADSTLTTDHLALPGVIIRAFMLGHSKP